MSLLSYSGINRFNKQDDLKLWKFFLDEEKFKENKKMWDLLGKKYGKKKLFDLFFLASEREDIKQNIVGFLIKIVFNVKTPKKSKNENIEEKKTIEGKIEKNIEIKENKNEKMKIEDEKNIKNKVKKKLYETIEFQNQVLDLFFKFKWLFSDEKENKEKYIDKFKEYKELKLQKRKDMTKSIKNKIMRTLYYKRKRS